MFKVAVGDELQDLGDNVLFQHPEIMFDNRPALSLLPLRQGKDARAHRGHLRPEIQRVDGAKEAAAEGGARGGQRAVGINRKLGAIRRKARHQRRCDGACKIAAQRRCAQAAGSRAGRC